jgi:hypothetical protein
VATTTGHSFRSFVRRERWPLARNRFSPALNFLPSENILENIRFRYARRQGGVMAASWGRHGGRFCQSAMSSPAPPCVGGTEVHELSEFFGRKKSRGGSWSTAALSRPATIEEVGG